MIAILSPSKTLDENPHLVTKAYSQPSFLSESAKLAGKLKTFTPAKLRELMNINPALADLNAGRYQEWELPFTPENARPALLMFKGEVFNGLKANTLAEEDLLYAQDHLRILSGFYGILRPLDIIRPYRLEMGTKLKVGRANNLYAFWGGRLTTAVNEALAFQKEKVIVNVASQEYFHALDPEKLNARVVNCHFREERNGKYTFITVYGKHARGMMTRFMIDNRIEHPEDLKAFDSDGYYFNSGMSGRNDWFFTR